MVLVILGLSGCATLGAQQKGLAISNLYVGKVCGPVGAGNICEPTYDIVVDDHGTCMYDHQLRHCTWYGFSFDHPPIAHDVTLDCRVTSDVPQDVGNPERVIAHQAKTQIYPVVLPKGSTHFFNPQYVSHWMPGRSLITEKESCSYHDQMLFQFTIRFHPPAAGA